MHLNHSQTSPLQVCGNTVFLERVPGMKTLGTAEEEPQEL